MFDGPGVLSRYLVFVAVTLVGYFALFLVAQSWYKRNHSALRALLASIAATSIGQVILLSIGELSAFIGAVTLKSDWYFHKGLLLLVISVAALRYLAWLLVFWVFFRDNFKLRPSPVYAAIATLASFGVDVVSVLAAIFAPKALVP